MTTETTTRSEALPSSAVIAEPAPPARVASIDAYRGFVMLLMASEGLGIGEVARRFPQSRVWQFLAYETDHVQWIGCALWDLIQPSFSFLVGVAMPFSLASRRAKGQSERQMMLHAAIRSFVLIMLGILLRSQGRSQTYFTFEDTLTQIGLGYFFLFLLARQTPRIQAVAAAALLVVYWLAFLLYPLPPAGFDYGSVGVKPGWEHLQGLSAHWDKNTNFAAGFDQWFLNLFPREKPFTHNGGGYLTLSFIPTLATMIFGLLAGGFLKSDRAPEEKIRILVIAGIAGLVIGWSLGLLGICPVVKRIWTPSWAIFSGGWCCLLMAAFYAAVDLRGQRRWTLPLIVVGMNSIATYVIADGFRDKIDGTLKTNLGEHFFENLGGIYAPILEASASLLCIYLIVYWMYRRKIFLRV